MIYLHSDYSQGALPDVMEALAKTNTEHSDGYGLDPHCAHAAEMIKQLIGNDNCEVHFMVGGTPCNVTVIAAALRPYECVIAAKSGHAYRHETGAVEATGHRVTTVEGINGKLTPELIDVALKEHEDEHTPQPGLVYISQPTEIGSVYSRAELEAVALKCREHGLLLYLDGARLGAALTCAGNDLSLADIARLCDAFYIGGTKNGALFGEALVICSKSVNDHFRYMIKRQCGLLAKGRLLGVQFEALLEGGFLSPYFKAAEHANALARKLREGLKKLGVAFFGDSPTNQVFPILPAKAVEELRRDFFFYNWAPESEGMITVRLVTSWGTEDSEVEAFLSRAAQVLQSLKEN